ncbi:hypothetical protein EDC01DRAFT_625934 [Geopyxis carbonaria]|nr:hypothetical protein EDC01DRAFT_625934 [Geopyxis carbonaria]
MSAQDFLADASLGSVNSNSWADEMEDMPARGSSYQRREYGSSTGGAGNDRYSGYSRADTDSFQSRAQLPVPDRPPYTAHVGNLSFDATEGEIEDFFNGCDVSNVRLVHDKLNDRPKGFGYVEFNSKDGLIAALEKNSSQLAGRSVRISVAEPPKDRPDDRTAGNWERKGPLQPLERETSRRGSGYERSFERGREEGSGERRQSSYEQGDGKVRDFGNWERKGPLAALPPTTPTSEHGGRGAGGDREFRRRSPAPSADGGRRERPQVERQPSAAEQDNQWRRGARPDAPQRSTPPSPVLSRPRLALTKRSEQPIDTGAPTPGSDKPNPFGAARPIDTLKREKEVEEKRAAAVAEKKAKEEKLKEEKKAAAVRPTPETSEKGSDAGTPTGKSFEVLRRGSSATNDGAAPAEASEESKETKEQPKKVEKPQTKGPDNWRSKAPAKEQKTEDADGWSTVQPTKRGRGSTGGKAVPAS